MSNEYPYASMRDSFDLSAYFVVGPEDCKGRPLTDVVDQALHGGATFIQLRAKEADASELTDMARVPIFLKPCFLCLQSQMPLPSDKINRYVKSIS